MREIPLTQGKVTFVDDQDFTLVSKFKWCCKGPYARRAERIDGKYKTVLLHRFLLQANPGQIVDHIDRNPLNNIRANLRITDVSTNNHNIDPTCRNKSGFLGVCWEKAAKKWRADINRRGVRYVLGLFATKEEAHQAYQAASKRLYG